MGPLSAPDLDGECPGQTGPPALHIPTEVCENIIDMLALYSDDPRETLEDIATLRICARVCRDWRVRSQRMLFFKVLLDNSASLHRLAAILDARQHTPRYIHEIILTGDGLHTTTSIFTLFPALLARKLPNLKRIVAVHPLDRFAEWALGEPSDPPKAKDLPYIPLHPRFPSFLSSFTGVSYLRLEHLSCYLVRWITWTPAGTAGLGIDFTKPPDWAAGKHILPPFAPNLRNLWLSGMAVGDMNRLISTRGPHLRRLDMPRISLPHGREERGNSGEIDLRSCTGLEKLALGVPSHFSMDDHADCVAQLLASWKPDHMDRELVFRAYSEVQFKRRGFADALRGLGSITEAWLHTLEESPQSRGSGDCTGTGHRLLVEIYDQEAEREWWWDHLCSCFPILSRLGRLDWVFKTPPDERFQWATEES